MKLKGMTAIITGASGVVGGEIAIALAKAGCNCICQYNHNKEKAENLVGQIEDIGVKAITVQADLTNADAIESFFESASAISVPQILINSAAVFSKEPLAEVTFEKAQNVLNLNLVAPMVLSGLFAERIEETFGDTEEVVGKIINISDVSGVRAWANYGLYCSSKAGLIGLTKALAKELAPKILVNSIAPGIVVDWQDEVDEEQKQRQLSFIPMGRIGTAEELTSALIFLLENDYITGQILNVDGGRCI